MTYEISTTEYRRSPAIPPIIFQQSGTKQFATADTEVWARTLSYEPLIYLQFDRQDRFLIAKRYSKTVLRYGAAFLILVLLAIVVSIVGVMLEQRGLGILSIALLAAAAVCALLWTESAQRERQQLARQAH
jgi:hypothetical protein